MADEVAPLIVGVCLANDAGPAHSHPLTTITLPPAHMSHSLTELRPLVTSSLPPSLRGRAFLFLSHHGWEIATAMETAAKIQQVFRSHTHSISIRFSHPQPRVGLVVEGNPPVPLGFLFCEVGISLTQLRHEIARQLPALHTALVAMGYSLLDSNAWPIGREQEALFSLAEIIANGTVRLRLHSQQASESLTSAVVKATALLPPSQLSLHPTLPDPTHSLGSIAEETADMAESSILEQSLSASAYDVTMTPNTLPGTTPYEILLSYVHRESSEEAILLSEALQEAGHRVFLDVECIRSGTDWQDVLNSAVSNCTVFIPLITEQYGQTLWTNREVKLADVLGKVIIPVNFQLGWPPQCLAIQFAATQYISWPHSSTAEEWNEDTLARVVKEIVERYRVETSENGDLGKNGDLGEGGRERGAIVADGEEAMELGAEERRRSFARADTAIIEEEAEEEEEREGGRGGVKSGGLLVPRLATSRRRSTIKSYASTLPPSVPTQYAEAIQGSRSGKPLVVVSCHTAQQEFARDVAQDMEGRGYETWCSCSILHLPMESASQIFQLRANEAGVVIFIFSKEFTENLFCENQVYYCEQRKRIIPVIYEPIQLPHWVSLLIGTSPFISRQSSNYQHLLAERVREELSPERREVSLRAMLREKAEISRLCAEVARKLPKGRSLVYISGGTRFYSENGEQICRKLGRHLAQDLSIILVTGGFFGVGETVGRSFHDERRRCGQEVGVWHLVAERDDQDKSSQTRQNEDGSFPAVPYGETIFAGSSVRQREVITPHVVKLCVLIEGGPGAAFEAQQFSWNGNTVIPVGVTGGAATGLFNVPQSIFQRPPVIDASDWSLLSNKEATPTQIADTIVRIIRTLIFTELGAGPRTPGMKQRKWVGFRSGIQRSETVPRQTTPTSSPTQPMKRTFSDSSKSPSSRAKLRATNSS